MHWKMINPADLNIKQAIRNLAALLFIAGFMLAGCQGQSILDSIFPQAESQLNGIQPTRTPEKTQPVEATAPTENPIFYHLELWVPPQFDPNGDSESSKLLDQRIRDFLIQNPQVNLDVRIKAQTGPGSMMDSLSGANAVAQSAVPSLVLLSRSDLVNAANRNLIFPMEGTASFLNEADWFPFTQEMAFFQGSALGIPFVSNALSLIYQNNALLEGQPSWDDVLNRLDSLVFPAGDTDALVTLALYQSAGGGLGSTIGQTQIDQDALLSVLNLYDLGKRMGVIRRDVLDFQTEEQAWQAFNDQSADAAVVWANRVISGNKDLRLAILPSLGDKSMTLATGWAWCLSEVDDNKRQYAIALAEYLSAPDFLAQWAPLSGYLPVRPSSLTGFGGEELQSSLSTLLASAKLRPDRQSVAGIATQFESAVAGVIKGTMTPDEGVQSVMTRLEESEQQ